MTPLERAGLHVLLVARVAISFPAAFGWLYEIRAGGMSASRLNLGVGPTRKL